MARARPALHNTDPEMIPRPLLGAMAGLAIVSLLLVSYAVLTERETVGRPAPAEIVFERMIVIESAPGNSAVTVRDPDGAVVLDLANGGFIDAVHDGIARNRSVNGIANDAPVRLVEYANGRLSLKDPQTGWSVELQSFGADNKAAFERLTHR